MTGQVRRVPKERIPVQAMRLRWVQPRITAGTSAAARVAAVARPPGPVLIEEVHLLPDWTDRPLSFRNFSVRLLPGRWTDLPPIRFTVPPGVSGLRRVRVALSARASRPGLGGAAWQPPVLVVNDEGFPLQVGPLRPFLAFVSRSLRLEDAPLIEPFVKRLQLWGLNPHTVGVDVMARDPRQVSPDVREWIAKCDCLVAVATPREALASGGYQPPDWIHSELGIAFGREKPFLLIHEASVRVGGLPERTGLRLSFEAAHPEGAFPALDAKMPEIRAWCEVGRAASRRAGWIDLGTKTLAAFGAIRLVQGFAGPERPTRRRRRKRGRSR